MAMATLALVAGSTVYLLAPKAKVFADTGPNGDYGGATVYYELIDEADIASTHVSIPIYFNTKPTASVTVKITYDTNGHDGQISIDGGPAQGSATSKTFTVPASAFTIDPSNSLYVYVMDFKYVSPFNHSMPFEVSTSAGTIGYSASHNDNQFAVTSIHRCDAGGDTSGCGQYSDYMLQFAPACSIPSGSTYVDIYDPDNPYPLPNGSGSDIYTQPRMFGAAIYQNGVKIPYTLTGTWGNGNSSVSTDVHLTFNYVQGDKYQLVLGAVAGTAPGGLPYKGVYANNVLQFKLPFDSINYGIDCANAGFTNTPSNTPNVTTINADNQPHLVTFPGDVTTKTKLNQVTYTVGVGPRPADVSASTVEPSGSHNEFPGLNSFPYTYTFRVPPTTPNGTQLCSTFSVTPASDANPGPASATGCVTVYNPTVPALVGNAADVHAGGGRCNTTDPLTPGLVLGNGGSYGQYVVSSSGGVSAFGSNGSATNPNDTAATLKSYFSICRPDLVAAGTAYVTANATPSGASTYGGMQLSSAAPGGIVYVAGNATINASTITQKTTLFATGTVTINGNITLGGPNEVGSSQPSLGIIAAGNIEISNTVATVDAYLFSDSTIDTCYQFAAPANHHGCLSSLAVNGFLMAKTLAFHRLAPANSFGTVPGETVTLIPQLYLNPPILFEGGIGESLLQDTGELPPLN